jgi:DNA replication protein DnaC
MTPTPAEQAHCALIEAHATELKLPTVRASYREMSDQALRDQQTPISYLAALLDAEVTDRIDRRTRRRINAARFPQPKTLDAFRFADNPAIPQTAVAQLADADWITRAESVILIGESGTGKTHLATALGIAACYTGHRVRFTTLAQLANELIEAADSRDLARVVRRYARLDLLILDELGYLALPEGAAELVFQVISDRNERASLIVTTNLPFSEWTRVFTDARLAKAVVDRITHHAHIIDTGTDSWRFKASKTRNRRTTRKTSSQSR